MANTSSHTSTLADSHTHTSCRAFPDLGVILTSSHPQISNIYRYTHICIYIYIFAAVKFDWKLDNTVVLANFLFSGMATDDALQALNSRQILCELKGEYREPDFALPAKCEGPPPDEPNAYSDGSLLNPRFPDLGLGGAGIFYPLRDCTTYPLQTNELDCDLVKQETDGVSICGAIIGPRASSTRTELAGGIMALSFPGPLHLASDSLNFVRTAMGIIKDAAWRPPTPWELFPDGDLWNIFHAHVEARGRDSVQITWIKGHTTLEHVHKGIISYMDMLGNSKADELARLGVDIGHSEGIVALACVYARRMQLYYKLVMHIHDLYLRILPADMELRDVRKRELGRVVKGRVQPPLMTIPKQLPNTAPNQGRQLSLSNPCAAQQRSRCAPFIQVWAFIASLTVLPTDADQQGISWLELFALFEMKGGSVDNLALQIAHKATTRSTIRKSFMHFKKLVREVVLMCVPECDQFLFKPSRLAEPRLRSIGYTSFTSCLMFRLCLADIDANSIVQALLALRVKMTFKVRDRISKGQLLLPPRKLSLTGMPPWRSFAPIPSTLHSDIDCALRRKWDVEGGTEVQEILVKDFTLACPSCNAIAFVGRRKLYHNNAWTSLKCKSCSKITHARIWKCSCNVAWIACGKHCRVG